MKKKYFGTDGIRAASNSPKLNGLTMMRLGMSLGKLFTKGDHRHRVVIGKDTRLSGYTIEPVSYTHLTLPTTPYV